MNSFFDYHNDQVAKLPLHLKKYIIEQEYDKYTPVDHAVWRYVMRQNYSYLKNVAYYPYIPGLKKAGLTIEKIPSLQDEKLLEALEELVEDFLYSYRKSKEGGEDHEWHAMAADDATGAIYDFVKEHGTEQELESTRDDTFFDDLKREFVEDY